ncbi:hypothetical protein PspMM1_34500 [Pseudoalteromonas sp. MM1]|nr:hypothetical protein PspMM1_34500 [Pseudoalteromonas sp. MM1]
MSIKISITTLLLCALLSACSTAPHYGSSLCREEAGMTGLNGSQTSPEVYNECMSAQIKKDAKEDTFLMKLQCFLLIYLF